MASASFSIESNRDDDYDDVSLDHSREHIPVVGGQNGPEVGTSSDAGLRGRALSRPEIYAGHPELELDASSGPYLSNLVNRIVKETTEAQGRTASPVPDADGLSWPCEFELLFSKEPDCSSQISLLAIGTKERKEESPEDKEKRFLKLQGAVRTLLECIGEDPTREGLLKTPERYAKAMMFFTKGYEEDISEVLNGAIFHEEGHDDMVIVRDIDVR
jgi:hypothetical protein